MNHQEGLDYIRGYFEQLFGQRNVGALDVYLAPDYFDDDIGGPPANHLENSKHFLLDWFSKEPNIMVAVKDAITQDEVISAFLEWYVTVQGVRKTLMKGVAIFVLRDRQIIKRHTYIYEDQQSSARNI